MRRGFYAYDETKGRGSYYWPYVEPYLDRIPENPVFYPSSGYKDTGQSVSSVGDYLYSVSSNPSGTNTMHAFVHRRTDQSLDNQSSSFQRNLAFPVRCISYTKQNQ